MKILALCTAVATTSVASALDLKSPEAVAQAWNQSVAPASESIVPDSLLDASLLSTRKHLPPDNVLAQSSEAPKPGSRTTPRHPSSLPSINGEVFLVPNLRNLDPKILRGSPGKMPPPGAKSWIYRGQPFWLIPIDSASLIVSEAK
jgi:hypothetical protein